MFLLRSDEVKSFLTSFWIFLTSGFVRLNLIDMSCASKKYLSSAYPTPTKPHTCLCLQKQINYIHRRFIASFNEWTASLDKQTYNEFLGRCNATPNPVYIFVSVPQHQTVAVVNVYSKILDHLKIVKAFERNHIRIGTETNFARCGSTKEIKRTLKQ